MSYNYVDTHAHLYMEEYDEDREQMLQRAAEAGVTRIILPNVDQHSLPRILELKKKHPETLSLCLGLHPTSVDENYEAQLQSIYEALDESVCGIGEIGIDLYHETKYLAQQQQAFRTQLQWAADRNLPVALHVRSSFPEVFEILKDFPTLKGVFHCFSGGEAEARKIVSDHQFYLGIGGVVTFKNNKLLGILQKSVPPHRLVLETDAPFLSPTPHRGQRNESAYLPLIAQVLADAYALELEQIAQITTENAEQLFGI